MACGFCGHDTREPRSPRRPLGFSLDDKAVKRAGLDYWPRVDVSVHDAWQDFETSVLAHVDRVVFYSKKGKHGTVNALDADLTCVADTPPRAAFVCQCAVHVPQPPT